MEYEGYLTVEEVLARVDLAFPFVERPGDDDLYIFDTSDLMRKIISSRISGFTEPELPFEGVMELYSEFSTISNRAVEWMFPSLLRVLLRNRDMSGNLHWYLPGYFENLYFINPNSAYNFSWLSIVQLSALNCVFEYLSENYGVSTGLAQVKLVELENVLKNKSIVK